MTSLAALLLSHGARTIPSSRLAKEVIHLGNRPVCLTPWYYKALPRTNPCFFVFWKKNTSGCLEYRIVSVL
jgi:hypothetical protein